MKVGKSKVGGGKKEEDRNWVGKRESIFFFRIYFFFDMENKFLGSLFGNNCFLY